MRIFGLSSTAKVKELESLLAQKEQELACKEAALNEKAQRLNAREAELQQREHRLTAREQSLSQLTATLNSREQRIISRETKLEQAKKDFREWTHWKKNAADTERQLAAEAQQLAIRQQKLTEQAQSLDQEYKAVRTQAHRDGRMDAQRDLLRMLHETDRLRQKATNAEAAFRRIKRQSKKQKQAQDKPTTK